MSSRHICRPTLSSHVDRRTTVSTAYMPFRAYCLRCLFQSLQGSPAHDSLQPLSHWYKLVHITCCLNHMPLASRTLFPYKAWDCVRSLFLRKTMHGKKGGNVPWVCFLTSGDQKPAKMTLFFCSDWTEVTFLWLSEYGLMTIIWGFSSLRGSQPPLIGHCHACPYSDFWLQRSLILASWGVTPKSTCD